jgi:hypothetical protein
MTRTTAVSTETTSREPSVDSTPRDPGRRGDISERQDVVISILVWHHVEAWERAWRKRARCVDWEEVS